MTLEKAKKKKKITKIQLQKQKQVQNVIVNLQAPAVKKTRKRTTRPKPVQIPSKSPFQSPIYMPTVASYNQPKQDNNSILSDILKHIKPTKPEPNELEKTKPQEREAPKPPDPILPPSFGAPERIPSLVEEIRSDPFNTKQTFINTPQFEAQQEPFVFNAPLRPAPLPQSLLDQIQVGQKKKFTTHPDQPWAELETGGTFGLLGVNDAQIKAHKEAKKEFTHEAMSMPVLTEEPRPTSEEIDIGLVPHIAQEIVQEDRVETNEPPILQIMAEEPKQKILIPEKIATKSNTEQMQMNVLTMGEGNSYLKSFLHSTPVPPLKTISFTKDELDLMRGSRVKALEKPPPLVKFGPEPPLGIPLSLKQEPEPTVNPETKLPLSAEKEVIPDNDPEIQQLKKLNGSNLKTILSGLGGNVTVKPGTYKKKTILFEEILELRKTKGDQFTKLLNKY